MIDRIFKNWKTSIIGAVLIASSMTLVFLEKATLTEVGAFLVVATGLFFTKDKVKK